jgi:hypothetical protein
MKNIILFIIVIGVLFYFRGKIWALPIFDPLRDNPIISQKLGTLSQTVEKGLTEQTVTDELKTWVLKDGVKLPKDWVLKEKTFGTQKVTIMVPPNPKNTDDYIALSVKKETITKLPTQHICKEDNTTATCLVGGNYETLKVFSVMTFVK